MVVTGVCGAVGDKADGGIEPSSNGEAGVVGVVPLAATTLIVSFIPPPQ